MAGGKIMAKWEEKRLGELCRIGDGAHASLKRIDKGILYLTAKNITLTGLNLSRVDYISEETYKKYFNQNSKALTTPIKNDILYSIIGSIGGCYLVGDEQIGISSSLALLRCNPEKILSKYLIYFIKSDYFNKSMESIKSGVAQGFMSLSKLSSVKITVPDIPTQERIADILSAYDDLIENNNRRIELLEKVAQNLYKEWFIRFRFPGYENAKFENGLPVGWRREKIDVFYKTCSGGTPSRGKPEYYDNGIYPWVKTGEIRDGIVLDSEEHITEEAVEKSSAKLLPSKSVVMAMYGVNIGKLSYFDGAMTCNQACCVFSDKRLFSSKHYLFYYLKSIREYLLLISFGAAQQNLSQDLIKKIKMVMPGDKIILDFEKRIEHIYNSNKNLQQQIQNLKKQRDLLLPRLMSGKLEV